MNTGVLQLLEQCQVLQEQSVTLLHELYLVKTYLLTFDQRQYYFKDHDFGKIRTKIEKKFPALPDFTKLPNYESFLEQVNRIKDDFTFPYEVFSQVITFLQKAKQVIKDFPTHVLEFKLKKNRPIMFAWMQLLIGYMKICYMVDFIPERDTVLPLYCAVAYLSDTTAPVQFVDDFKSLLDDFRNFHRSHIDSFASIHATVLAVLLEIKDTVYFGNNVEHLRNTCVFNPIYEGASMGLPSQRVVSSSNDISVYLELTAVPMYYDFVAYSLLACPQPLFHENVLDLLASVTSFRALFPIFRDLTMNLHIELEKVSLLFPQDLDRMNVPKGFKLKSRLKHISRDGLAHLGRHCKTRRVALTQDLHILTKLCLVTPGLIAPKLPVVLAACTLLKDDVLSYFRHHAAFAVRKDTKTYFQHSVLTDNTDIPQCLYMLYLVDNMIERSEDDIVSYYQEFIVKNDSVLLQAYEEQFSSDWAPCQAMYNSIMTAVNSFVAQVATTTGSVSGSVSVAVENAEQPQADAAAVDAAQEMLTQVTVQTQRLLLFASNPSINSMLKTTSSNSSITFDRFILTLYRLMYQQVLFASVSKQKYQHLVDCVNPYLAAWYRSSWMAVYQQVLKREWIGIGTANVGNNSASPMVEDGCQHVLMFMRPLQDILFNVTPGLPLGELLASSTINEVHLLGEKAIIFVNTMLVQLADYVLSLFKQLWEYIHTLESLCHPLEVIKRLERHQPAGEALPGVESEHWASEQIQPFVQLQQHLSALLQAIHRSVPHAIQVYTRVFRIEQFISEQILKFFAEQFTANFYSTSTIANSNNNNNSGLLFQRFSQGYSRLMNGWYCLQFVFRHIPAHRTGSDSLTLAGIWKELVFSQILDVDLVPPLGLGLPLAEMSTRKTMKTQQGTDRFKKQSLIDALTTWFVEVVTHLATGNNNNNTSGAVDWVYLPASNSFANLHRLKEHHAAVSSNTFTQHLPVSHPHFCINVFLSHPDLQCLVKVIGIQGVRLIEAHLFLHIEQHLQNFLQWLKAEKHNLQIFHKNASFSVNAIGSCTHLHHMATALKHIAMALLVRSQLLDAVQEVVEGSSADMLHTLQALFEAMHLWTDASLFSMETFVTLAHSMGIRHERDVVFFAAMYSLIQHNWTFADMRDFYHFLPMVGAALLVHPERMDKVVYRVEEGIFENNDHVLQYAIAKLMVFAHNVATVSVLNHVYAANPWQSDKVSLKDIMFYNDNQDETVDAWKSLNIPEHQFIVTATMAPTVLKKDAAEQEDGGEDDTTASPSKKRVSISNAPPTILNTTPRALMLRGSSEQDCAHYMMDMYLRVASEALLTVYSKGNEGFQAVNIYSYLPFSAMMTMLRHFIRVAPAALTVGHLEQYIPYDLIHSGLQDMSLGRFRIHEDYQAFKEKTESPELAFTSTGLHNTATFNTTE